MNRILSVDPVNAAMTVEAGVILAKAAEAAREAGYLYPISLAAEGTAEIGGTLAANAGGVHVVRYGMARRSCLGIEVVLADGRVVNLMRSVRKDNTGYDLRDLFIGSEGTLGIITKAVLDLSALPAGRLTVWAPLGSLEAVENFSRRSKIRRPRADCIRTHVRSLPRLRLCRGTHIAHHGKV